MPVTTALQGVPDLPGRVVQPGDVTINDGNSITIPLNRGGDITERNATKKQIQFNVRGLTGPEVANLDSVAQANLLNELNGVAPAYRNILISGITFEDCTLIRVQPSGSLTVGTVQVVDQTQVTYETRQRYLT